MEQEFKINAYFDEGGENLEKVICSILINVCSSKIFLVWAFQNKRKSVIICLNLNYRFKHRKGEKCLNKLQK